MEICSDKNYEFERGALMKRTFGKILSFALVLAMVLAMVPAVLAAPPPFLRQKFTTAIKTRIRPPRLRSEMR